MIILGIVLILFQSFDIISTKIAIKKGCEETNPFFKKSINQKQGFSKKLISFKLILAIFLTFSLLLNNIIINWSIMIVDIFYGFILLNNLIWIIIAKLKG